MSAAVVTAPLADAKPKAPSKVSKVRVSSVTTSAVTISWKNPKSKNFKATIVRLNMGTKASKSITTGRAAAKVGKNKHAVRLVRLRPNTLYTASIFSSGGGKVASKPVVVRLRTKALPKPKPTKDTTAPGRVSSLVVTVADGAAKLVWKNPADKDFRGVTIFRTESAKALIMKRSTAASETKKIADLSASQNSFTDSTIEAGRSYSYSLVSKDASGNTSAAAKPASAAVTDDPAQPVNFVDASNDDGDVYVFWSHNDDPHLAGVKILRKVGSVASSSVTDGTAVFVGNAADYNFTDKKVDAGQTYVYTVFAVNGSGIPAAGVSSTVTTDDTPRVVSISGTVKAKSNGAVLKGVSVSVFDADGNSTDEYTDADGTYRIRNLEPGTYVVCFDAIDVLGGPSTTGYAAQCADGKDWDPRTGTPAAGAREIKVTETGGVTVNGALTVGSAIKGEATSGSTKVSGARVVVLSYDSNNDDYNYVTSVETGADGSYAAVGLPVGNYYVCVDGSEATGGGAPAGFLSECFDNQPWDPNYQPSEKAQAVSAPVTGTRAGTANFDLGRAGGIAGTISGENDVTVAYGQVNLYDDEGNQVRDTETDGSGHYAFTGLIAGDYTVCVRAYTGDDDLPEGGLSAECFEAAAWNQYTGAPAKDAKPVTVTLGALTSSIDVKQPQGGAISGSVYAAYDAEQPVDASVRVFDESGQAVAYGYAYSDGSYLVSGLRPGTNAYRVCFEPYDDDANLLDECYSNVAWDGNEVPAEAKPVSVQVGKTTSEVDGALDKAAAIEGHVSTENGDAAGANVYVYDAATGDYVAYGDTEYDEDDNLNGDFRVSGLRSGDYYVCFNPYDSGIAAQCYKDAAWDGFTATGDVVSVTAPETKFGVNVTLHPVD